MPGLLADISGCIGRPMPTWRWKPMLGRLSSKRQSDDYPASIAAGIMLKSSSCSRMRPGMLAKAGIKTIYIEPGSPWSRSRRRFIESFNGRLRAECLVREQLWTLSESKVVIEGWRWEYNHIRPHRSLGYVRPLKFTGKEPPQGLGICHPDYSPSVIPRPPAGSANL